MRAVLTDGNGGPEVLRIGELPDLRPADDEVLIAVAAAGVNRADLQQRHGNYPPPPGASEVIGLECSGRIAAVGAAVEGWRPGDACVALLAGGGYAEQVRVPAGQVLPPPDGMDLVEAGGVLEVAATVVSNLDQARLRAGESFLVHGGAGGIGSFAIQYAKAQGAQVFSTAGTEDKLTFCREIGADLAVSYHDDWVSAIKDATDGRGVDVILDNMGAGYLQQNTRLLATDGRLMVIGLQGGREAPLDLGRLLVKRGTVAAGTLRGRPVEQKQEICRRVAEQVWPLYASGAISLPPITRLPLTDVAAAHRQLESGDNVGKIILEM